jgi:hypothetical protein
MTLSYSVVQADRLDFFRSLEADSVDLVFGSPPYEKARTYGIDFALKGQAWVDWMVETWVEASRVCRGVVAFVLEGQTKDYRWSAVPALLMADLTRKGFNLRKPPVFHRVGIPGSGGKDWLRNDYEFIVCTTRPGKLPWADNTAMGHPPKWAPGGAMSNRLTSGERVNQWGRKGGKRSGGNTSPNGAPEPTGRPSHVVVTKGRRITRGHKNGDTPNSDSYVPPVLANPGNVIHCKVGGNLLGSKLAHENEAPFPERLAEFFVLSFCPPGGLVADCFSGSGTTGAAAVKHHRRFAGCDVRPSQVELSLKRVGETVPVLAEQE